jgi:hypothetical protein
MSNQIDAAFKKIREGIGVQNSGVSLSSVAWSLAEDYSKRVLEGKYDQLAKTDYFRKLKSMDARQRLLVELGLYLANGFFIQGRLKANTPSGNFIIGILSDFFPEMGKRLVNGDAKDLDEIFKILNGDNGSRDGSPK